MNSLLYRIDEAKHKFCVGYGVVADTIFLGPKEMAEVKEHLRELERRGMLYRNYRLRTTPLQGDTLSGLKIICLAHDGLYAGVCE